MGVELKMMPAFLELVLVVLFCLSNQADQEPTRVCQDSGNPLAKLLTMNSGIGELPSNSLSLTLSPPSRTYLVPFLVATILSLILVMMRDVCQRSSK